MMERFSGRNTKRESWYGSMISLWDETVFLPTTTFGGNNICSPDLSRPARTLSPGDTNPG